MECNIFLDKPELYGTTGSLYNLTKSYLEYRYLESQIGRKFNDGSFWMGKNYTWNAARINPWSFIISFVY
jgi:hypothetical protein